MNKPDWKGGGGELQMACCTNRAFRSCYSTKKTRAAEICQMQSSKMPTIKSQKSDGVVSLSYPSVPCSLPPLQLEVPQSPTYSEYPVLMSLLMHSSVYIHTVFITILYTRGGIFKRLRISTKQSPLSQKILFCYFIKTPVIELNHSCCAAHIGMDGIRIEKEPRQETTM